jgi:hypothetical protein
MAETLSLMEFIRELLFNDDLRQDFSQNPEGTLADHGLANLSPDDVHDALVLVEDNQTADFSRDFNVGNNASFTPPPPVNHAAGGDVHHQAVEYLNSYITNNFVTDNSFNQQVDTGGGDFDQEIDIDSVVASGDGAVAAGDDIRDSTITTGDDNQVGDGNIKGDGNVVGDNNQAVTGNGNTTSFGDGDATSTEVSGDVSVGAGGAFGSGGEVTVDNSDNSLDNVGNTSTDNSINDSFKDSSDNSVHDSGNLSVDASTNDSFNDNSETTTEDSFNDESDNSLNTDNSVTDSGNVSVDA